MPRTDKVYICPVCESVFATRQEARECMLDHDVESKEDGCICDCGAAFTSEQIPEWHMEVCEAAPPGCINCNNFEYPDIRHAPCKRSIFSEDMSPCPEYRRIKV